MSWPRSVKCEADPVTGVSADSKALEAAPGNIIRIVTTTESSESMRRIVANLASSNQKTSAAAIDDGRM